MNGPLILVDGMAVIYRAYFAIPALSTKAGCPTNAVFGFIRMMNQLRHVWKPTHWAVVFDGGLPESRLALLDGYKAQRPSMPDALRAQIPVVEQYLERASIVWTRQDRQEADDIIASLATKFAPEVGQVLLATGDKDMYQLVTDKISVIPVSGSGAAMGPDAVKAKTGVAPAQIVDWLALAGDSSDNIPGVHGVGPKTAAKLLLQYGAVRELLERLDELPRGKVAETIGSSREIILRNMELVRLKLDLECPCSLERLEVRPPDVARLIQLFRELEFNAMAEDLMQPKLFGE